LLSWYWRITIWDQCIHSKKELCTNFSKTGLTDCSHVSRQVFWFYASYLYYK